MIERIKQLKTRYESLLTKGQVPASKVTCPCYSKRLLDAFRVKGEVLDYSRYDLENSFLEGPAKKISLILTIKNEELSLPAWFDSLLAQTRMPDEIIVCDGGSTDKTVAILRLLFNKLPQNISRKIVLASEFGPDTCSISAGRNRAIEKARNEIIAVSDLGCELDKNWLYRITLPLIIEDDIDFSMGWSEPLPKSDWAKAFSRFLVLGLENIQPKYFLASARSLAFKRSLWFEIGGFPEYLSFAGEDTLFSYYSKYFSKKAAFVPEALVFWNMPVKLKDLFKTVFRYAKGDAEGGKLFFPHYLRVIRVYLLSFCGLFSAFMLAALGMLLSNVNISFLALALFLFSLFPVLKLVSDYRPFSIIHAGFKEKIYLLGAAFFMSIAQLYGYLSGVSSRKEVERKRLSERTSQCIIKIAEDSNINKYLVKKYLLHKLEEGYLVVLVKPLLLEINLDSPALNIFISGHFKDEVWQEKSKQYSVSKYYTEEDILEWQTAESEKHKKLRQA